MAEHKKIGKIKDAFLGVEDHGILTIMLNMDYGSSGQSIGGYALDSYDSHAKRRVGAAYGTEWILRVMRAVGVSKWDDLKGKTIFVLLDGDDYNAKVIGIEPLPTEPGERLVFADIPKGAR